MFIFWEAIVIQIPDNRTDSLEAGSSLAVAAITAITAGAAEAAEATTGVIHNSNRWCHFDSSCRKPERHTPNSIECYSLLHGCSSLMLGLKPNPKPINKVDSYCNNFAGGSSTLLEPACFCSASETGTCVGSKHYSLEVDNLLSGAAVFTHILSLGDLKRNLLLHLLLLADTGSTMACMQPQGLLIRHFDRANIYSAISNSYDNHQLVQI